MLRFGFITEPTSRDPNKTLLFLFFIARSKTLSDPSLYLKLLIRPFYLALTIEDTLLLNVYIDSIRDWMLRDNTNLSW